MTPVATMLQRRLLSGLRLRLRPPLNRIRMSQVTNDILLMKKNCQQYEKKIPPTRFFENVTMNFNLISLSMCVTGLNQFHTLACMLNADQMDVENKQTHLLLLFGGPLTKHQSTLIGWPIKS